MNDPISSIYTHNLPLEEIPVIGNFSPEETARRLEAMGDLDTAAEIRSAAGGGLELFGLGIAKPWQHTAQQVGFIGLVTEASPVMLPIQPIGNVVSDVTLKNQKINIKLDRLNISDYPGKGIHQVMVVFKAQNQLPKASEAVSFSQTYRVQHGQTAAVAGYPVFIGLNTGLAGASFELFTINVKNEDDIALLNTMNSDTFRSGLDLLSNFQPAIKPFTEIVLGVATSFLKRNENVKVQHHYLGLDFSTAALGVRLAQGNYIVAQVPSDGAIHWDEWVFDRSTGSIVRHVDGQSLSYNYLVFRVEQHSEG
jgi:hypothetical protein